MHSPATLCIWESGHLQNGLKFNYSSERLSTAINNEEHTKLTPRRGAASIATEFSIKVIFS
jgi:hypothetical protein